MSIAILCPSRSRPERFDELLDSIVQTAHSDVHVYCGLDTDDPLRWQYPTRPNLGTYVWGARQQLAAWTNDLAKLAIADGHTIIGSLGDDHRPRTAGWDVAIERAMVAKPGLVYGRDGLQDERLPTAPFWPASVISALGWFFPPVLKHLYADNAWLDIARAAGCSTYLPDVFVEHLHPDATGEAPDEINRENDSHFRADEAAYRAWLADDLDADGFHGAVGRVMAAL